MRKLLGWIILFGVLGACGRHEETQLDQAATEGDLLHFQAADAADAHEPQSYLVAFRHLLDQTQQHFAPLETRIRVHAQALLRNFSRDLGTRAPRYLASLNLADPGQSFTAPQPRLGPDLLQTQLTATESMASLVEITFASDQDARETLTQWWDEGRIYYAEPNGKSHLDSEIEDQIIDQFKDNKQGTPWLEQVAFLPAIQQMSAVTNKSGPVVAVMDSGVDVLHASLRAAIYTNESGQNKLCKDDFYGCNTTVAKKEVLGDGDVFPAGTAGFNQQCPGGQESCQHGTHVAGLIAARDALGYVGMCPYCQILVVKVVDVEVSAGNKAAFVIKDSSIIAGLAYVSGFKVGDEPLVRVINASFGKFERSRSVELFIKSLKNFGRGTLLVAAAGNEDTMKRQYPAAFDSVVAVSNVISDASIPRKSSSSNFGTWVDIAAPGDGDCQGIGGQGVLSSIPGNLSACKVGTSMASPMVAGIAGLLLTKEPALTATQVEQRLLASAVPDKLYTDAVNNAYRPNVKGIGLVPLLGSGIVNANLALDPTQDDSPPLATQRNDLVKAGCGLVGGMTGGSGPWWLFTLPLLIWGRRHRRKFF